MHCGRYPACFVPHHSLPTPAYTLGQPVDCLNVIFGTSSWWSCCLRYDIMAVPDRLLFPIYNLCYGQKMWWTSNTSLLMTETDIRKTDLDFQLAQLVLSRLCHSWIEVAVWLLAMHGVDTDRVPFCVTHCVNGVNVGHDQLAFGRSRLWPILRHFFGICWEILKIRRLGWPVVVRIWTGWLLRVETFLPSRLMRNRSLFWNVIPCGLVDGYQPFRANSWHYFQGEKQKLVYFFGASSFLIRYFVISVWCLSCVSSFLMAAFVYISYCMFFEGRVGLFMCHDV
jgi:hypothetical protein